MLESQCAASAVGTNSASALTGPDSKARLEVEAMRACQTVPVRCSSESAERIAPKRRRAAAVRRCGRTLVVLNARLRAQRHRPMPVAVLSC